MLSGMKSCFAFHWRWLNSSAWYLFRDYTSGKRTCPLQLCVYPINSHFLLRGVPESISWGNADHDQAASNAVVKFGLRWYPAGSHSMASSTTKPARALRYKITGSVSQNNQGTMGRVSVWVRGRRTNQTQHCLQVLLTWEGFHLEDFFSWRKVCFVPPSVRFSFLVVREHSPSIKEESSLAWPPEGEQKRAPRNEQCDQGKCCCRFCPPSLQALVRSQCTAQS